MNEDKIADLLPLESTRELILEDIELLRRVVRAWQSLTLDILVHNPLEYVSGDESTSFTDPVSDKYRELTETIIYWWDVNPKHRIDPTAITDLSSYMLDADVLLSQGFTREEVRDSVDNDYGTFNALFNRAINVTDRIFSVTGTQVLHRGRPRSQDVAKRREKVKKCLEQKMKAGEIAWKLVEKVATVKQDIVRIRALEKQALKPGQQKRKVKK